MLKVFDIFTIKRRYFVVEEKNMVEAMRMIQSALSTGYHKEGMNVGNCGWAEEANKWFIHVNLTNNQWQSLLGECKNKKYQLVIKENPNDMYFTKIEGSK